MVTTVALPFRDFFQTPRLHFFYVTLTLTLFSSNLSEFLYTYIFFSTSWPLGASIPMLEYWRWFQCACPKGTRNGLGIEPATFCISALCLNPLSYQAPPQKKIRGQCDCSTPLPETMQLRFPHFGNSQGSSQPRARWPSLALGKPPSWSWYFPCQVRILL